MPDRIKIACSAKDCEGSVYYEPADDIIVMGLRNLLKTKIVTGLTTKEFTTSVKIIVEDPKIKLNTTDTIYLTCTGDPNHTRPYEIPA